MIECPGCYKAVENDISTCNYCGYSLSRNRKTINAVKPQKGLKIGFLEKDILTPLEWILFIFLLGIPLLNIFILYFYGFKERKESNISNFCRAITYLIAVYLCLYMVNIIFELI